MASAASEELSSSPQNELERLEAQIADAEVADETFALHFRAAQISLQLTDSPERAHAKDHLRSCWDLRPGDPSVFAALNLLLEEAGEAEELAALFVDAAQHADSEHQRATLLISASERFAACDDDESAQAARREVAGLKGLALASLRLQAAQALIENLPDDPPLDDRLAALELLLPNVDQEQAHACAMEIAFLRQKDGQAEEAIAAFGRALSFRAGDRRALDALRQLLVEGGDFAQLATVLETSAKAVAKIDNRAALYRELAELCELKLTDDDRAASAWWRAWESAATATDEPKRLKRIFADTENWNDYYRVLQREAACAKTPAAKVDVYRELATFQREALGDDAAAVQTHGLILQLDPSVIGATQARAEYFEEHGEFPAAIRELKRWARQLDSTEERDALYRRAARLEFERKVPTRAIELLRRLASENDENGALALELYRSAEADEAFDGDARRELGNLALSLCPPSDDLDQLGLGLAKALEAQGEPSQAAAIYRRLAEGSSNNQQARSALAALQQHAPEDDAAEALAKASRALDDSQRRRKFRLLLQAAQVLVHRDEAESASKRIGDYLREAMNVQHPLPARDLPLLETALREAKMYWELADLLADSAEQEGNARRRRELLSTLADLLRNELDDPQRAVGVLEQAYDLDRSDTALAQEIRRLHLELNNHAARAQIVEGLLANATGAARWPLLEELGQIYAMELDDQASAMRHYDELIHEVPDHSRALAYCRASYEESGDFRTVAVLLSRASESKTDSLARAEIHREIASIAEHQLNDLDFAIAQWRMVVELLPADTAPRADLKRLLARAERWHDVESALLSEVSRSIPEEKIPVYLELAQLATDQLDDLKAAASYLRNALQLAPENLDVMQRLATIYEETGQWRELATILRRHADAETDVEKKLRLMHLAARVLLGRLEREEEALAICRRVREMRAGDRVSATLMAEIYSRRRRWQQLAALLREQIDQESDPLELGRLHIEVGRTLLERLKEPEAAATHFELALDLDAGRGEVMSLLRQLYATMGRWDLLIELIRRRATADELSAAERAAALCEIGRIREEHQDDLEGAWEAYENAAHLAADHRPALTALKGLAITQQKWRDAVTVARRELDLVSDQRERGRLLVEVAELLQEQLSRPSAATEAFEEALLADPNNTDAVQRLATLYFDSGDWEQAGRFLEQVVNSGIELDNLHDYYYRLAYANERLGKDEQAFGFYVKSFGREPMYLPTLNRLVDLCHTRRQWDNVLRIAEAIVETYADQKSNEELAGLYVRLGLAELHLAQHKIAVIKLQQIALGHGSVPTTDQSAWQEVAEHWAATPLDQHLLPEIDPQVVTRVIKAMEQALNRVADHADALQTLAALTACRGDWERCLRFIERASDSPGSDRKARGMLLLAAGEIAVRYLRDGERAESYLAQAKKILPGATRIDTRLDQLKKRRAGQRVRTHTGPSRVPAPKSRPQKAIPRVPPPPAMPPTPPPTTPPRPTPPPPAMPPLPEDDD